MRAAIVALCAAKIEAVTAVSASRWLGVAVRVAREQIVRSRTFRAVTGAVRMTGRSFGRAAQQLWLEVTGTVFLAMAAFGAAALVREYLKYSTGHATIGRVAVAMCFTLAFGWFGFSSFWRVRRKSRR